MNELVAEMSASFLSTELGVPQGETFENHAAYIKSWLKAMNDDPSFIFKASTQASKVADFLLSFRKTHAVLVPESVWKAVVKLRGDASEDSTVFRSRKGGHLDESQIWRIVRKASERAGIDKEVSCHWLRHAHASHALDRGAPIHLVQATLNHSSISTTGKYLHARPNDSSGNYLPLG